MVPRYIKNYWGKARATGEDGPRAHPLAYHNLDVAAAGEALLEVRPQLIIPLVQATGLPEGIVRSWLLFALAVHDIGKFADCFQCKATEHWQSREASYWQGIILGSDPGHGRFGYALWKAWSDPDDDSVTPHFGSGGFHATDAFDVWMQSVAGHHGRPVEPIHRAEIAERICSDSLSDARDYAFACAQLFSISLPAGTPKPNVAAFHRTSWLVAGLAMVSDWIGSNQEWFSYCEPTASLGDYLKYARGRARKALVEAGLAASHAATSYALADALPNVQCPSATPLQMWAVEDSSINGQSLIVIEDLTGAGKTEAGLLAAHRLMRAGAAEGLYWALPTMATADALYRRLAASYSALFADVRATSLALAHGARDFNDIFQKSIRIEDKSPAAFAYGNADDNADITASATCARWIADDRRKTFLADVGVGTIDQALLGILPSKHQAMRLAGLARRVLVIDEAHSFDAYMTALTEALLRFHAALGGSAIIMSATLTAATRAKLAKAFADGAGWPEPRPTSMAFPLATVLSADGLDERPLASSRGTRRDLHVERLDDEAAAIEVLTKAHEQGQGAVWIRNTVQDAMDAYAAVRARLPKAEIDLFHARFALGDRLEIEKRVLDSFGKGSTEDKRHRIVVATQVVEQSLDCDWDVMISDLAPIDLLIQRAGRLHRHDRGERPAPVLHIVGPAPVPDAGPDWYRTTFPRAQYVYKHHGQLWLTMRALLDAGGLNLQLGTPRDLIERVFAFESTEIPAALEHASSKAVSAEMSARAIAGLNALDLRKGYVPQAGAWESDTKTPTRLGDPQRVLRLAKWDGRTLSPWTPVEDPASEKQKRRAWRLSEVSVLATRVADITYTDTSLRRAVDAEVASWPESYDPPLLVPLERRSDEAWEAHVKNNQGHPFRLRYGKLIGLQIIQ